MSLALYIPCLIGFSTHGILKGSLAAKIMSILGPITKASIYSLLQSMGALGLFNIFFIAGLVIAAIIWIIILSLESKKNYDMKYSEE